MLELIFKTDSDGSIETVEMKNKGVLLSLEEYEQIKTICKSLMMATQRQEHVFGKISAKFNEENNTLIFVVENPDYFDWKNVRIHLTKETVKILSQC